MHTYPELVSTDAINRATFYLARPNGPLSTVLGMYAGILTEKTDNGSYVDIAFDALGTLNELQDRATVLQLSFVDLTNP